MIDRTSKTICAVAVTGALAAGVTTLSVIDHAHAQDAKQISPPSLEAFLAGLSAQERLALFRRFAAAQQVFSPQDKRSIVSSFLSSAARVDASDMHSHLTGLMGLMPSTRQSPQLGFEIRGKKTSKARSSKGDSYSDSYDKSKSGSPSENKGYGLRTIAGPPNQLDPLESTFGSSDSQIIDVTYDLDTARRDAAERLGLAQDGGAQAPPDFNIWVAAYSGSEFIKDDPSPNGLSDPQQRSEQWSFSTGAHYKAAERLTVGAMFRSRSALGNADALSATTDLKGVGVGVYTGVKLTPNLALTTLGFYERGNNLVSIDGNRGEYTSDHISLSTNIKGYWRRDAWWFSPSASVTWASTSASGFTDTSGAEIAGSKDQSAHASIGPQIGYVYFSDGYIKAVRPHLAFIGIYSFLETGSEALSNGFISGATGFRGQISGGFDLWLNNSTKMKFDVGYDGIGTDEVNALTLQSRVDIPLN